MDDPTLLIHWLFSWLATAIMVVRLVWRRAAMHEWNVGDYLTMAALVCVFVRMGMIHIVLTDGTNNLTAAYRNNHVFSQSEIDARTLGSKMTVSNRFFYNSYLWIQKLVLLDVYRRLLLNLRWEKAILILFSIILFLTYVTVQVFNVIECRPIYLYWQVVPDPGTCVQAELQLIVLGVLNIVTDAMLLILPFPLVFAVRSTWQRKAQLSALFTMGIFVIVITIIRLPINSQNITSQVSRTTWASVELLTAAIVVNAVTFWSLWNKRNRDKDSNADPHTPGDSAQPSPGYLWHKGWSTTKISSKKRRKNPLSISADEYTLASVRGIRTTREVTVSDSSTAFEEAGPWGKVYKSLPEVTEAPSKNSSQDAIMAEEQKGGRGPERV